MVLAMGMAATSLHCTRERKEASQAIQLLIPCFCKMKSFAAINELWCTQSLKFDLCPQTCPELVRLTNKRMSCDLRRATNHSMRIMVLWYLDCPICACFCKFFNGWKTLVDTKKDFMVEDTWASYGTYSPMWWVTLLYVGEQSLPVASLRCWSVQLKVSMWPLILTLSSWK